MNCLKRLSFALAFCLAASIPVWGQTEQVVYVATGGPQVYAVATDGTAKALIPTNDVNSSSQFTSLTVGPDNTSDNSSGNNSFFLYACDAANSTIIRLRVDVQDPASLETGPNFDRVYNSVSPLSAPVCGRVGSNGDLYVSSGSGIFVIHDASSTPVGGSFTVDSTPILTSAGSSLGGITQKNNGDMLVVNTAGKSVLYASFGGSSSPPAGSSLSKYFTAGLNTPVGIARANVKVSPDTAINEFFVANQGNSQVLRFDPTDPKHPTTCSVNVPSGNVTLSSVAASEDNFVYVGIASTSPNKREVAVLDGGSAACTDTGTPISLSGIDARTVAAVAVPPVGESPIVHPSFTDPSSGALVTNYNFGSSLLQIAPGGCTFSTVGQTQMPLQYLQTLTSGITTSGWYGGTAVAGNGEGGFGTVYTVEVTSGCTLADVQANFLIGGFYDPSKLYNPRIIHCDDDFSGCTPIETTGNWPTGGYLPDDSTVGGHIPGFGSKYFLVNGTLATSSMSDQEPGTFCGFESPLSTTTDPTQAQVINGNNISVKFKLVSGFQSDCSSASNITDAVALISVALVSSQVGANATFDPAAFQHITIVTQGSSADSPPTFKYNTNSSNYQFSLNLKGYQKGTYALSITFLTNNTGNVYTYFAVK